jgi:hypothetical protein
MYIGVFCVEITKYTVTVYIYGSGQPCAYATRLVQKCYNLYRMSPVCVTCVCTCGSVLHHSLTNPPTYVRTYRAKQSCSLSRAES